MNQLHARATIVFSSVLVVLGLLLVVETALAGGGLGYVLGAAIASVGALRVYLVTRRG